MMQNSCVRFTRKVWRKTRANKTPDGWSLWDKNLPAVQKLFDTMEPFVDDDAYDVAKTWNLSDACHSIVSSSIVSSVKPMM